jgi:N-acetylneuraminic acid mutarotase
MVTARSCFTLCEVGGLLNAAGGLDGEGGQLASVECYDPILDTWSIAPALPRRRSHHSGCAVGDSLYILGGMEGIVGDEYSLETTSVLKFDSGTQAWSEVAPMPEARASFATCVLGRHIYAVGGQSIYEDDGPMSTTYCYNAMTNVWSTLSAMPEAKMGHSVCVMSDHVYVLGGLVSTQQSSVVSSVHRFDPAGNTWSTVAPMSTPRSGLTSFVLGGSLHAAGGFNGSDYLSSVERYDVASDSWNVISGMELSTPRVEFEALVMTPEVALFDSLETKARRARS